MKLSDAVPPPRIMKPYEARSANPVFILTTTKPQLVDNQPLHFRVQVFEDEAMSNMISEVRSDTDAGAFEYSLDGGATWTALPSDGLPPEAYGAMLRVKVNVGPRQQVWVRTGVGIAVFEELISGFVYDTEGTPISGATVYVTDSVGGEPIVSTQTESDGFFVLLVEPGTYVLVATASGYKDAVLEGVFIDELERIIDVKLYMEALAPS